MVSLTVRDLDDEVKRKLRLRAAHHGRSMEAEVRTILADAVAEPATESERGLGSQIHAMFAEIGGADDLVLARYLPEPTWLATSTSAIIDRPGHQRGVRTHAASSPSRPFSTGSTISWLTSFALRRSRLPSCSTVWRDYRLGRSRSHSRPVSSDFSRRHSTGECFRSTLRRAVSMARYSPHVNGKAGRCRPTTPRSPASASLDVRHSLLGMSGILTGRECTSSTPGSRSDGIQRDVARRYCRLVSGMKTTRMIPVQIRV